jgi:murein L,D-transpeptidase YcbB/YkuD
MREIAAADDWGLKAGDFELPAALAAGADTAAMADAEFKLALAVLEYARHARGGRMDPTDLSFNIDRKPPLLEPLKVLADAASAGEVDAYLRKLHPQHPQFELLRQKYLEAKRAPVAAPAAASVETSPQAKSKTAKQPKQARDETRLATRILYNMEMWRWMPEELGAVYVSSNIPEFMMRVVKADKVIHEERIIAGKVENQTPIFSDMMEHIVFHPFWGVPDSIKVKEIWPGLAGGGSVLERNGLRIQKGGRDIDPSTVNWSSTDIRQFHVYQPPGGSNVLGVVKFMFPNKHQVYMHDTPTKTLFNSTQRTFSHGCMRVRNPVRLAEVLLENDKGWDAGRVGGLVKGGPQNNHVYMDKKIPVHVTYFTAVVGSDGKLQTFPDVYGHEPKIQMGLDGKAHLIVKKKPSLSPPDVVTRLAETKQSGPMATWMKNFFGGF